jgi:hypothetical protein
MSDHDDDADPEAQDDEATSAGGGDDDARVADGVEHLQRAAHEMIAAARTFLDVVEDVVGDNAAVASVAEAFGSWGQAFSRAAGRASEPDGPAEEDGGAPGRARSSRVQHIDLS